MKAKLLFSRSLPEKIVPDEMLSMEVVQTLRIRFIALSYAHVISKLLEMQVSSPTSYTSRTNLPEKGVSKIYSVWNSCFQYLCSYNYAYMSARNYSCQFTYVL